MMKLFKLLHCIEIDQIGQYPQISNKWPETADYWGGQSYTMTPLKGYVRKDVIFPVFSLSPPGKANDWVGDGAGVGRNYWMISARLFHLVKEFHLDVFQYFLAPVNTAAEGSLDYYLIYFPWPRQDDFINWEKSIFEEDTLKEIQFKDSTHYLMKHSHNTKMQQPVVFPEKITVDLFRFSNYSPGFYVSERLKNAMEAAGMTGIVYEEPEWLPK